MKKLKSTKKNKIIISIIIITTLFIIYGVYNNNIKNKMLNETVKTIKEKIPTLRYEKKSCFVLNGCLIKNVSFELIDKKIKIKEAIFSNKSLEVFSKNFKDDKVAGVILLNDISFMDKNLSEIPQIPTFTKSASIILKLGKFDKNVLFIDFSLNKGPIAKIDDNNSIFKISFFGETDKNVTFKSWDSIPPIKGNKVLINKKLNIKLNIKLPKS